jgi:hypothetical protein
MAVSAALHDRASPNVKVSPVRVESHARSISGAPGSEDQRPLGAEHRFCLVARATVLEPLSDGELADGYVVPRAAPGAPMEVSAELLGQSDDDALRATQEAEPVDVLVLRDLADEFGTVAAQAGNDVVDVVDSEHDAA